MWPDTRIRDLFGIEHPIIQAPMGGASGLDMALAVGAAGGLGSLACGPADPGRLRTLLSAAQEKSERALNVNFFAHVRPEGDAARDAAWLDRLAPYYAELGIDPPVSLTADPIQAFGEVQCAIVEEFSPAVVSFHFGLPAPELVARVSAAGCKVISSATTVAEARWLAENGCDAIIAQGFEAGGHRGMFLSDSLGSQMGTLSLVPQIADTVQVPVIAAGGIADVRGIVAAFALGASAVQIGTAYLFTDEATISPVYRQSLADAEGVETTVSNLMSGRPTRVLANRLIAELGPMSGDAPAFPKGFAAVGPMRSAAEATGNRDFSAHYCGQSAPLCRRTSAFKLTRDLASAALHHYAEQKASPL